MAIDTGILVAYSAILCMAVAPILMGSRASVDLIKLNSAGKNVRRSDDSGLEKETLSTTDAYWFPITGSTVLFGLYLLFKYLNKEYINTLLTGYFALVGVYALTSVFSELLKPLEAMLMMDKFNIYLTREKQPSSDKQPSSKIKRALLFSLKFTHLSMMGAVVAILITAAYVLTKNWILNNIFGLCLSVTAITLMDIDSFQTGMTLLSGLFIYDIFWVFGTDVMVSVAKSFDAPIKLLFPKTLDNFILAKNGFTMLGLGDIVLPGIYVALSLRYDYHNYLTSIESSPKSNKQHTVKFSSAYPTPYYHGALFAYVAGLATTVFVMHTFQAAQPALLYLSPACILSTLVVSLVRGQLKAAFAYSSASDKELKDKLIGVSPKEIKRADKKKTGEEIATSSSSGFHSHDSEDETMSGRRPRKMINPLSPRKLTENSKSSDEHARAGKQDMSESAEAAAERKRKRREAERFDFDEQAAAPVTKRVHAAEGKQDENDDSIQQSLASQRSRPGTRDTTSGDEASGLISGKSSSKKSANKKSAPSSTSSSAPAVFTDAVAETGVGKSAGKKKNMTAGANKKSASPKVHHDKSVNKRSANSPDRASSPSRSTDAGGASTTGDDDEFMVVSRKGRKANKGRHNSMSMEFSEEAISSPPISVKAASKQASVSDDITGALLADPADWGF